MGNSMAPKKKTAETTKNLEELSLEQALAQLDEVMERLESGELSLEESFRVYQRGMELVKHCNGSIDRVEKQLLILEEEGI